METVEKRVFKGRPKMTDENRTLIKDPIMGAYQIEVTEDCFILQLVTGVAKPKPMGYFTTLGGALNRIAKAYVDNQTRYYTLKEYINEYKQQVSILNNQFL